MALLRLVRDRTKRDEAAFEVIQGPAAVMFVSFRATPLASSPGLSWLVTFEFRRGSRKRTITGMADSAEAAFYVAVTSLRDARPRTGLPDFTSQEWATLKDELRRDGVFGP